MADQGFLHFFSKPLHKGGIYQFPSDGFTIMNPLDGKLLDPSFVYCTTVHLVLYESFIYTYYHTVILEFFNLFFFLISWLFFVCLYKQGTAVPALSEKFPKCHFLKISSFWCLQISQKTNEMFYRISALASKKRSIKKIRLLYTTNCRILFWLSYTTF